MTLKKITLGLLAIGLFASCEKEPDPVNIKTPTSYEFSRDGQSTVSFSGQTARIGMATELIGELGSTDNVTANLALEMFRNADENGGDVNPFTNAELNASTKSVKSKVSASKDIFAANVTESTAIRNLIESWITKKATEVNPNKDQIAEKGKAGQIADGSKARYVNAQGLEYNQAVAKTLIGALMLDQVVNNYLSDKVLDEGSNRTENDNATVASGKSYTTMEHKWDEAFGYVFGASANPALPLEDLGSADAFLNKYVQKVNNDEDFNTIGKEIVDAFSLGRAAIVGKDYELRDKQVDILRKNLSKVVGVRAVHYLGQGALALEAGNYGSAFHDLSEGLGFVYSLRYTREAGSSNTLFSKAQVDGFISKLTSGNGFWDLDKATLDQMCEDIAAKFDFTVDQAVN